MSRFLLIVGLFLVGKPLSAEEYLPEKYKSIAWIQDQRLIIAEMKTETPLFPVTIMPKRAGTQEPVPITLYQFWGVTKKQDLDRTEFDIYGTDGKPFNERDHTYLLKEVWPVILCENHLMEEKERKLLKEGTLIIVRKTK